MNYGFVDQYGNRYAWPWELGFGDDIDPEFTVLTDDAGVWLTDDDGYVLVVPTEEP